MLVSNPKPKRSHSLQKINNYLNTEPSHNRGNNNSKSLSSRQKETNEAQKNYGRKNEITNEPKEEKIKSYNKNDNIKSNNNIDDNKERKKYIITITTSYKRDNSKNYITKDDKEKNNKPSNNNLDINNHRKKYTSNSYADRRNDKIKEKEIEKNQQVEGQEQ